LGVGLWPLQGFCGRDIEDWKGRTSGGGALQQEGCQRTVVASNKRVSVAVDYPAVNVFLCLFQRYIHISIEAGQHAWIRKYEISV